MSAGRGQVQHQLLERSEAVSFGIIRSMERCQQLVSGEVKEQDHEAGAVASPNNSTQARGCMALSRQEPAITPPLRS